jgi:hypothetical protein
MAVLDLVTSLRRAKYAQGIDPQAIASDEFVNAIRSGQKSQELKRDLGLLMRQDSNGKYFIQSANITIGDITENACFATLPTLGSCLGPKGFLHTYEMRYCFENRDDILFGSKMQATGSPLNVPFRNDGDNADSVNSRLIAQYTQFMMNRAHIIGTETSPNPSTVWSGLAQYFTSLNVQASVGNPITSIEFLSACLDDVIGGTWINGIHYLGYASMEKQLRNTPAGQIVDWAIVNGRLEYKGQPVYKTYLMPFDTGTSTTQLFRVNTNYVGLIEVLPERVEIKELLDDQGCMKKCVSWAYGGGVIVTDERAIQLISGVPVDAACLTALSGAGFNTVNPTSPFLNQN